MCGLLMSLLCIPPVPSKLSNGSSMQNFADTAPVVASLLVAQKRGSSSQVWV